MAVNRSVDGTQFIAVPSVCRDPIYRDLTSRDAGASASSSITIQQQPEQAANQAQNIKGEKHGQGQRESYCGNVGLHNLQKP
jgi:hypothetical protein